jgi:hypothetical protein
MKAVLAKNGERAAAACGCGSGDGHDFNPPAACMYTSTTNALTEAGSQRFMSPKRVSFHGARITTTAGHMVRCGYATTVEFAAQPKSGI